MKGKPIFSIVVPTYNRATLIPYTIHSVVEQTFFQFELIIVDDGSTDATEDVVKPYLVDDRVSYYKIKNSERGAARNYGVSKATGAYVTFLDSDDILLPWHFERAHEVVKAHHGIEIFHQSYEIVHANGKIETQPPLPSPVNDKLLEGNFLSCMGVFIRKDVALENKFNERRELSGSEDYELWLRIAARKPIYVFPNVTSRLIHHDGRSVINMSVQRLTNRIAELDNALMGDPHFQTTFGKGLSKFSSYRSLYLSLHLAICGERWLAFRSLIYTFYLFPRVMFTYRFLVVIKKIILW